MTTPVKKTNRLLSAALAAVTAIVCLAGAPRSSLATPPTPIGATPPDAPTPGELGGIGIDDHAGREVPRDIALTDQNGQAVKLGDYFDGKHPVVLALAYYECPMLCSLVLKGVLDSMKEMTWTAGEEYRVVIVSFDPRDTPAKAAAKRLNHVDAYHREVKGRGFDFLVGDEANVKAVANAVGFTYRWDEREKQFAHAAGAFVLMPSGKISRTLYGMSFPDMRLAVLEASEGKVGTVSDKFLLFCFHYDPAARGYVLATLRLMKAGGVVIMLLVGALLVRFWRVERRRSRSGRPHDDFPAKGPGDLLPVTMGPHAASFPEPAEPALERRS
ncbi:Cytochrome oxidase biogenesis protein Sco1/SenC/PrrC [Minicystis rosea]|nr:Cytochrome oxidase biogenesis protein Sco1/SenC/PrrC [Minicystis rosea]